MAGVLGITLKHATTKHAQTNWATRKISRVSQTGIENRKKASRDHCGINTSALRSLITTSLITLVLAVKPSRVFYGRIPYNMLDLKMGIRP